MIKKTFTILIVLLITVACSSSETSKEQAPKETVEQSVTSVEEDEWVPDEYKTSELAELMRQMHTDHLDLKAQIEQGKINLEKTSDYAFIHKATPTDPNDDTPLFHTYADAYLIADSVVYSSKTTADYKSNFNAMVNSCIACHENFCMGPINKIELLRIE